MGFEKQPKPIEDVLGDFESAEKFNLDEMEVGKKIEVETLSRTYTIEKREDGLYISGNPKYCPNPTKVRNIGSTMGGSSISSRRIVIGGNIEFFLEDGTKPITTSEIKGFSEVE